MQHTNGVHPQRPAATHTQPNWLGELCEVLASERLFHIPDCEVLLDRLAADCELLP